MSDWRLAIVDAVQRDRSGHALATRAAIVAGTLRGMAFRAVLDAVPRLERDGWVDTVLGLPELPDDTADLPVGAVPYLPCGVDTMLRAFDEAPLSARDRFVDLGAGVGRVVMLAHLCTGATAIGVEVQAPLVRIADTQRSALALGDVSFVCADAANVDLDGSVFFLYAPFNGPLLDRVMQRLHAVAQRRAIRVCAVDLPLDEVSWLRRRSPLVYETT